jgi:hypothetical protein
LILGGAPFHDLAAGRATLPAEAVEVAPPAFRGKRLLAVLSWLLTNSPVPSAVWKVERRLGPEYVRRELAPLGWELAAERAGRWLLLSGTAPPPHPLPPPRSFTAPGGLVFEADYGVFSPSRIDPGSELVLEAASGLQPVDAVADIGVGYGALAISLVSRGLAPRALATDVDSIALWLAERNARRMLRWTWHSIPTRCRSAERRSRSATSPRTSTPRARQRSWTASPRALATAVSSPWCTPRSPTATPGISTATVFASLGTRAAITWCWT